MSQACFSILSDVLGGNECAFSSLLSRVHLQRLTRINNVAIIRIDMREFEHRKSAKRYDIQFHCSKQKMRSIMKPEEISVGRLFSADVVFNIPLFQRSYVLEKGRSVGTSVGRYFPV